MFTEVCAVWHLDGKCEGVVLRGWERSVADVVG